MTVQELVTRWPLSPAFGSAAAVESGESWNGVAGPREWAFLLLSLAGLLWALPPLTWPLYAVTFAAVYAVGVSGLRRSLRLVLVLALLVGFLALERALPRPQVPLVLWSGRTIRAFFLLRAIDFVLTRPRRELSARPAHRVFQFLLFVTFFPCLFAGPVVLFNDFYRAYRPGSFAARSALLRNTGTIAWGALKFYALGPVVQRAVENLHLWAYEGGGPAGLAAAVYGASEAMAETVKWYREQFLQANRFSAQKMCLEQIKSYTARAAQRRNSGPELAGASTFL